MKYNPNKHHRHSIRMMDYDYSQPGAYFITICAYQRQILFGDIIDGKMILNDWGLNIKKNWDDIPIHYPNVVLDEFIVMPNHVHGIIFINDKNVVRAQNFEPLRQQNKKNKYQKIIPGSIGSIVRGFKIGVTKWFRKNTEIHTVWQRNFWEHIIRDEKDLNRIRIYIRNNPVNWKNDDLNN